MQLWLDAKVCVRGCRKVIVRGNTAFGWCNGMAIACCLPIVAAGDGESDCEWQNMCSKTLGRCKAEKTQKRGDSGTESWLYARINGTRKAQIHAKQETWRPKLGDMARKATRCVKLRIKHESRDSGAESWL